MSTESPTRGEIGPVTKMPVEGDDPSRIDASEIDPVALWLGPDNVTNIIGIALQGSYRDSTNNRDEIEQNNGEPNEFDIEQERTRQDGKTQRERIKTDAELKKVRIETENKERLAQIDARTRAKESDDKKHTVQQKLWEDRRQAQERELAEKIRIAQEREKNSQTKQRQETVTVTPEIPTAIAQATPDYQGSTAGDVILMVAGPISKVILSMEFFLTGATIGSIVLAIIGLSFWTNNSTTSDTLAKVFATRTPISKESTDQIFIPDIKPTQAPLPEGSQTAPKAKLCVLRRIKSNGKAYEPYGNYIYPDKSEHAPGSAELKNWDDLGSFIITEPGMAKICLFYEAKDY